MPDLRMQRVRSLLADVLVGGVGPLLWVRRTFHVKQEDRMIHDWANRMRRIYVDDSKAAGINAVDRRLKWELSQEIWEALEELLHEKCCPHCPGAPTAFKGYPAEWVPGVAPDHIALVESRGELGDGHDMDLEGEECTVGHVGELPCRKCKRCHRWIRPGFGGMCLPCRCLEHPHPKE